MPPPLTGFLSKTLAESRGSTPHPVQKVTLTQEKFHIQGIKIVFLHNIRLGMDWTVLKMDQQGLRAENDVIGPTITCFFFVEGPFCIE